MATENLGYGTGRRKTSVARVYLRAGNGNITINSKKAEEYIPDEILLQTIKSPLALADADESNRTVLGANGFLTRDSRMVERKKYGQRGARRRFQFSKR